MLIKLPNVTKLVAKFEQLVDRTGPEDTKAARYRVPARNAKPSAVANAPCHSSIRHQAFAGPQPVRRPAALPASSQLGKGTSPAISRSTTETSLLPDQKNFTKLRAFFEKQALESINVQPPECLYRSGISKRLGTGIIAREPIAGDRGRRVEDRADTPRRLGGAVSTESMAHEGAPRFGRELSCNEVKSRPLTMQQGRLAESPGPVIGHIADIAPNRNAVSSRQTLLQSMLERPHIESSGRAPSPASDENVHSGYENDPSGSSVGSSAPGSPNALKPAIRLPIPADGKIGLGMQAMPKPTSELVATLESFLYGNQSKRILSSASSKESLDSGRASGLSDSESSSPPSPTGFDNAHAITGPWSPKQADMPGQTSFIPLEKNAELTDLKDTVKQLERIVANEDISRVPGDAIARLFLAMVHLDKGQVARAHAATISALDGATKALTPPDSEADDAVGEVTVKRPATNAQCVRELRIIQRELFEMARKYPDTERGIAARNLHSTNERMFKVEGAGITYEGAVRLMPGIRSMSTARMG